MMRYFLSLLFFVIVVLVWFYGPVSADVCGGVGFGKTLYGDLTVISKDKVGGWNLGFNIGVIKKDSVCEEEKIKNNDRRLFSVQSKFGTNYRIGHTVMGTGLSIGVVEDCNKSILCDCGGYIFVAYCGVYFEFGYRKEMGVHGVVGIRVF